MPAPVEAAPTVSVVIPCFNDAQFLERALRALGGQTVPADEIVVVDNNSSDNSAALAQRFCDEGIPVRVIFEARPGILAAASTGYDHATGDIIARIDADTVPPATFIADIRSLWEKINEHNQHASRTVVATTGGAEFVDRAGQGNSTYRLLSRLYLGAYYASTRSALGHYPLFGTNFTMLNSWWQQARTTLDLDVEHIHDDLHLSFAVAPEETVWRHDDLSVAMDSRALIGYRQLLRRFHRGLRTMRVNFRRQSPAVRLYRRGLLGPRATRLFESRRPQPAMEQ